MQPNQKEILRQRIRQLEGEVVDRVRNYLNYQRSHNINSNFISSSHHENNPASPKNNKNETITNSADKRTIVGSPSIENKSQNSLDYKNSIQKSVGRSKQRSQEEASTLKKSSLFYNLETQYEDKFSIKIIKNLQEEIYNLRAQNKQLQIKSDKLQKTVFDLKEKYSNLSDDSEPENEHLMQQISQLQKKIKCLKCGEEELKTKLKIFKTKNKLLINALNQSQQNNYQLKIKLQKLSYYNSSIKEEPDLEEKSIEWENSQREISKNLFEALCNLPALQQHKLDDSLILNPPQNQFQLQNAALSIKKFSQCYDDLMEQKANEFKNVINKFFNVLKKLIATYQIDRKILGQIIKDCGFDGSEGEQVSTKLRQLLLPIRRKTTKMQISQNSGVDQEISPQSTFTKTE